MDQRSIRQMRDLEDSVMLGMSKKRILVIEDVPETQNLLRKILRFQGYQVDIAPSIKAAIEYLQTHGVPHLALVDIHLPDGKGFEFCQYVQKVADLPIILCTSDDDPEQAAQTIWEYAEDYITKPININELCARVYRVLSRQDTTIYDANSTDGLIHIDSHLSVDFVNQQIFLSSTGEEPIRLTAKETKILYILIRHTPTPVSQDFLINKIWGDAGGGTAKTLHVHIHSLRRKISRSYIHTVTEQGTSYLFEYREG